MSITQTDIDAMRVERPRVILESPFRGRNAAEQAMFIAYLELCIRDSVARGEAPFASHGLYPGALDDAVHAERHTGIECGYTWWDAAECVVFYVDFGYSPGMREARARALRDRRECEERTLYERAVCVRGEPYGE